jgi:hypothetical protein
MEMRLCKIMVDAQFASLKISSYRSEKSVLSMRKSSRRRRAEIPLLMVNPHHHRLVIFGRADRFPGRQKLTTVAEQENQKPVLANRPYYQASKNGACSKRSDVGHDDDAEGSPGDGKSEIEQGHGRYGVGR